MTIQNRSFRFIDKQTRYLSMSYLEALGGPTALGVFLCLKYADDQSACSHSLYEPTSYKDVESFRSAYAAVSLLSKWSGGLKGQETARHQAALSRFWACEERLRAVGGRLKSVLSGNSAESQVLHLARERIARILGPITHSFSIDSCMFGPGSSSSIPRRRAHPSIKYLSADVSASCAPFVSWFFQDIGFPRPKLNLVEHSRIEFVPKSFKIDRIIAVEPDWNIFFQKGVGAAIRGRLKLAGLDLDHAAERHRELAMSSSTFNDLATVDLSSASDSIATCLVRELLPHDWFVTMNSLRTNQIRIEDKVFPLLKFSSMGNGFTFELESLIFYSIAICCTIVSKHKGQVSVFGDDIILPREAVPLLGSVLGLCGFVFNEDKSFADGPFRESCGGHFYRGFDAKPIYIKQPITTDERRYHFANSIRRQCHRWHGTDVRSTVLLRPYTDCVNHIHRLFRIPDGMGDVGLVSYFDEAQPVGYNSKGGGVRRRSHCIEGYKVRCLRPTTLRGSNSGDGMYLHKLRSLHLRRRSGWHMGENPKDFLRDIRLEDREVLEGNVFSLSQSVVGWRVGYVCIPRWLDPGEV